MPATTHLHRLLDQVPESDLPTVERIIAALAGDDEPYTDQQQQRDLEAHADIQTLVSLPFDDEPVTDDERAAVEEALAEVQAGAKCYTTEELNRELGL
jgi:Flp pilus assembly CpaE family ATPase